MKIALNSCLIANTRFFKKVIWNRGWVNLAVGVKVHLYEFAEAGAVVIFKGLCVSECLQKRVGVKNLLLYGCFRIFWGLKVFLAEEIFFGSFKVGASFGKIWKNKLSCLSFTSAWFSSYDYGLIFLVNKEVLVRVFGDHKQVRFRPDNILNLPWLDRELSVSLSNPSSEDIESLVWVDWKQDWWPDRRENFLLRIPCSKGVQKRSFIELS